MKGFKTIRTFFKKIWMMFWTRKKIIEQMISLDQVLEDQVHKTLRTIEKLDQDKVYFIRVPETDDEVRVWQLETELKRMTEHLKWTMPTIFIINSDLKEVSTKELKAALEQKKKKR